MNVSLSNKDKLALISNLATMLSSGIPIIDAIDSMMLESKGNLRKILEQLKHDLSEGRTISRSLEASPKAFDPVTLNLIKAAEEAGTLDTTLKDIVSHLKKDMAFNSTVKGALAYPAFVVAVFVLVLLVILTFVIPRVAQVFGGLRVELPIATKVLMSISSTLLAYYPFLIIGAVVAGVLLAVLFRTHKRALINALLSLPLLRQLGRQMDLARLTRSLSLLLGSGIPIMEALELSEHVVVKREVLAALQRARNAVSTGHPLSDGLRDPHHPVIPGMMLRIIQAGEVSGSLEHSLQELSEYFEDQVQNTLKTTTTLIEPIMLVVIGLLVGGMMLAIIAPIYNLMSQINVR